MLLQRHLQESGKELQSKVVHELVSIAIFNCSRVREVYEDKIKYFDVVLLRPQVRLHPLFCMKLK